MHDHCMHEVLEHGATTFLETSLSYVIVHCVVYIIVHYVVYIYIYYSILQYITIYIYIMVYIMGFRVEGLGFTVGYCSQPITVR